MSLSQFKHTRPGVRIYAFGGAIVCVARARFVISDRRPQSSLAASSQPRKIAKRTGRARIRPAKKEASEWFAAADIRLPFVVQWVCVKQAV
jgi:hypothetical protein